MLSSKPDGHGNHRIVRALDASSPLPTLLTDDSFGLLAYIDLTSYEHLYVHL